MKGRVTKGRKYPVDSVRKAQKVIYEDGKPIKGAAVQRLLKATSMVPTSVSLLHPLQCVNGLCLLYVCLGIECLY